ncbi:MAG: hypothetical protein CMG66_01445 [Candidatus Marinimicrobia bacterium]|nr:hypothetical protein [Candidatus Neomarinimicrobiota bacterium]|tara:strand:+ start:64 stop:255 length:192 start_codon:yes stop_codon:yes gene_type:complete
MGINNILAVITIILVGISFSFIFKGLFLELFKNGILTKKDSIFVLTTTILVFIVYTFLEKLHH